MRRIPSGADATRLDRDVDVEADVPVPMSDGEVLRADLYRPMGSGRYPVLLMRLPYDKRLAQTDSFHHPAWYARQGYLVAVQDVRGCFGSGGDFYPFVKEADDGFETVEWAASLPRSNGRVGMWGLSYPGAAQLHAATRRPPSLQAICPGLVPASYHDGWAYRGGAFALGFNVYWATLLAFDQARSERDDARAARMAGWLSRWRELCEVLPVSKIPEAAGLAPYLKDWLEHARADSYWAEIDLNRSYEQIDVPALHIGGWHDVFARGTVENFGRLQREAGSQEARDNQFLLMGPWHHRIYDGPGWPGAEQESIDVWQLRWFDRHLKEVDSEAFSANDHVYLLGAGRWESGLWSPGPPATDPLRLYAGAGRPANSVRGGGTLSPEPPSRESPDVFVYNPLDPVPSAGGPLLAPSGAAQLGPASQAGVEARSDVLVYTSEPLERDLTVVGHVRAVIFAASTASDTDFTVKLCRVDAEDRSINVLQGVVRASHRESNGAAAPLTPRTVERFEIELGPTAAMFPAGHRLRLQVSSSDFPLWDRNLNSFDDDRVLGMADAGPATQTVFHDHEYATFVELPALPG
jgi:hypothetical protein